MKKKIAIIIPLYNEGKNLIKFYHTLCKVLLNSSLKNYQFKIFFVNDGSIDNSLQILKTISKKNKSVCVINMLNNCGKEISLEIGVRYARVFDAAIFIDTDLQHPPEKIIDLVMEWKKQKCSIVYYRNNSKNVGFFKKLTSYLFNFLNNPKNRFHGFETDFRIIDKKIIRHLIDNKFDGGLYRDHINSFGFKSKKIFFNSPLRFAGNSTYSFAKLFRVAIDNIFINTGLPMRLIGFLGALFSISFIFLFIYMIGDYFLIKSIVITPTSLLVVFGLILNSLLFLITVILSLFIQRIHKKIFYKNHIIIDNVIGDKSQK